MRLFRSRRFVLSLPGILEVLGIDMFFVFRGQTAGLGSLSGGELAVGGAGAAGGAQNKRGLWAARWELHPGAAARDAPPGEWWGYGRLRMAAQIGWGPWKQQVIICFCFVCAAWLFLIISQVKNRAEIFRSRLRPESVQHHFPAWYSCPIWTGCIWLLQCVFISQLRKLLDWLMKLS